MLIATVLPAIDSGFKRVIKSFREHRKYLPRDADLKKILKTQCFIVSDYAKSLSSEDKTSINDRLGSSKSFCLEIALAIRKKLENIEDLTKRLPVITKAKEQPISAVTKLKVSDTAITTPLK